MLNQFRFYFVIVGCSYVQVCQCQPTDWIGWEGCVFATVKRLAGNIISVMCQADIKGTFHLRRSNLSSAEPGSTLIVDLNQVQVMMCSTNVKLGSADVVQLNHDGYTSWTMIGPIWLRFVTSHALFTLVLTFDARATARTSLASCPQCFPCSHFLIIPPSRRRNLRVGR